MQRVCQLVAAALVMTLCASAANAQPQGGRRQMSLAPSPLMLLGQKSVQDELKLTNEQITSVGNLSKKQLAAIQGAGEVEPEEREKKRAEMQKESEKAIAEMLKADQAKRLKQIHMQLQGAEAFEKPEVVTQLKINDEQKAKIKEMRDEAQKEMRGAGRPQGGNREEARMKMQELNNATGEKIVNTVLNAEQKTQWKEMIGTPFKGEIRMQVGRPGGGNP